MFPNHNHFIATPREILDIMEFRLGGLYLQEMRDLRGGGATLAEVIKHSPKNENNDRNATNYNFVQMKRMNRIS